MVRCASLVRWSEASRDRTRGERLTGCAPGATRSCGSRLARRGSSFRRPKDGDESDLGWWSALDLGRSDYLIARSGPFAGLGLIAIPHDCYTIVRDRAVRDSIHAGPTREMELDCLECGACCRDNRVELEDQDIERFEGAGRGELARAPYARLDDGKVVLVLRRDKRCKHLAGDNRCGIYPIRPDACSTFPAGSECCLSSREEELGIIDGASP